MATQRSWGAGVRGLLQGLWVWPPLGGLTQRSVEVSGWGPSAPCNVNFRFLADRSAVGCPFCDCDLEPAAEPGSNHKRERDLSQEAESPDTDNRLSVFEKTETEEYQS